MPRLIAWRLLAVILAMAALGNGASWAERPVADLIRDCREMFGETLPAPDSSGGIAVIEGAGWFSRPHELCLYGSLEHLQADALGKAMARIGTIDTIIVRSTGGPVRTWLTLAEALQGQVRTVIVDDICISSCANYAFLLGDRRIVPQGALVVWHGGPVLAQDRAAGGTKAPDAADSEYDDLAVRTARYFAQRRVSTRLLTDTNELAIEPDAAHYFSQPGRAYPESFDGYAIDPAALTRCYGLTGLGSMWHPVFFESVYRLGKSRSANLNLLMRPGTIISPPCGQAPVQAAVRADGPDNPPVTDSAPAPVVATPDTADKAEPATQEAKADPDLSPASAELDLPDETPTPEAPDEAPPEATESPAKTD